MKELRDFMIALLATTIGNLVSAAIMKKSRQGSGRHFRRD